MRRMLLDRTTFLFLFLLFAWGGAWAQDITIVRLEGGGSRTYQEGSYVDIDEDPTVAAVFTYTGGDPWITPLLYVNGTTPANADCSDFGGGEGRCYFDPSPDPCVAVVQVKAEWFDPPPPTPVTRWSNAFSVFTYQSSQSLDCLPEPPDDVACGVQTVGGPINVVTGNMSYQQQDASIPSPLPIMFSRRYDSQNSAMGVFGVGWRHSYEYNISGEQNGVKTIVNARNERRYCGKDAPTETGHEQAYHCLGVVGYAESGADADITQPDGTKSHFENQILTYIEDRNGNRLTFSYTADGLATITDTFNRQITFGYTAGKLTSLTRPDARQITYEYDGNGRLFKANYPDGVSLTYAYRGQPQPNAANSASS